MAARTWRGNTYRFTVTAATSAAGDTYTNNGQTFTVTDAITSGTILYCTGTGAPTSSGNLVRTSGAGTDPIVFSAVTSPNTNWGTATNWLQNAVPTAADDVTFDATSSNCTLNVAGTCLSFNATSYGAKTWALGTNNISVAGGVFTLGTGMTVTGTGTLIRTAGGNTLTSNGVTWPGSVQINIAATHTWGDNWTIGGSFTVLANLTINGTFNITIGGSLIISAGSLTSTSTYILNGVGSLNGSFSGASITINTAVTNTITLPTSLAMSSGTLRLTSGIVSVTSGHLFRPTGTTLDTDRTSTGGNKISFFDFSIITTSTITLQSDLTFTNNFTSTTNLTINGAFNIYVGGNYSNTNQIDGTATLIMDGSNNATISAGTILLSLTISKSGVAVVTPASTLTYGTTGRTLTLNSIVNFAANSNTLTISGGPTIVNNIPANEFFNLNVPISTLTINGGTIRISSNLTLTGAGATFAGAFGWDCNNLICTTAGTFNITLQQGVTYRTRSAVSITGGIATAARPTMVSSDATNLAIWTLDAGATQSLIYVNGTRIDSSLGQTVWTFGGTVGATTRNWNVGTRPGTSAYTFVN
jgi:hypothetical protein